MWAMWAPFDVGDVAVTKVEETVALAVQVMHAVFTE